MSGAPPAFSQDLLARWKYKSGKFQGYDWIDGYVEDFLRNAKTDHIEAQMKAMGRRWEDDGIDEFSVKKLHTLYWIRFRLNPKDGREVPLDECQFPESWSITPTEPVEEEPWT